MLVSMAQILNAAREGGYGVTAPNIHNEDTARAAISAAVENRAPMILDVGYSSNCDINFFGHMVGALAKEADVPIAINLDHGAKYEHAVAAIQAGFTSIMVDRSTLPYEENVAEVAELVKVAHAVGVSVEAELGHVGQGLQYAVDRDAALTDPAQAKDYCDKTGIDMLAVAIGTAQGEYKGTPYLDFDRLHQIFDAVKVPLVLHGGSGTGDENLAKATREGISKVNLATDLYKAGAAAVIEEEPNHGMQMYELLAEGYKAKLVHYMKLFNQCNRV